MSDIPAASTPAPQAPAAQPTAKAQNQSPEANAVSAQPTIEDVEIELDEGMRFKKSELRDRIRRQKELEKGSYERFQQAAQIRKQTESLIQQAKEDPAGFLRQTGIDPEEFAKSFIQDRVKYYEMTPEQRELQELKQKLQQTEEEKRLSKEQQEKQVYQQQVEQYQQYFDQQFSQAMQQVSLPKTAGAVKRMAEKLEVYLQDGVPVSVLDVAREVKQDYIDEYQSTLSEWDDESFGKVFSGKIRERSRNSLVKDVKSPINRNQSNQQRSQTSFNRKAKEPLGLTDLNKKFEQLTRR